MTERELFLRLRMLCALAYHSGVWPNLIYNYFTHGTHIAAYIEELHRQRWDQ